MKDLRIVIVSWNVASLLERCLRSLPAACGGLDWECVVIDNASKDGSEKKAKQVAEEIGGARIRVVQSGANLGFAKACNLATEGSDARYVLYLNPDTECPPESLVQLVKAGDERPRAGILGPKLLYPDGSAQESIRRFPSFADQALIVSKLSHVFPQAEALRTYYARDLDPEKAQQVDQVMGACFLVRKELVDAKLGFDERYFIWMEEVDYCKEAKKAGWEVWYVPSVSVTHHQGKSFAQEFHPRRQKYFVTSLKKYFDKWHPGPRAWAMKALAPIGLGLVWMMHALKRPAVRWGMIAALLMIVSRATVFSPIANTVAAFVVTVAVFLLALKRPALALGFLLFERLIGSMGGMLRAEVLSGALSLRILVFVAFMAGWLIGGGWKTLVPVLRSVVKERWPYVFLAVLIVLALVRGQFLGNSKFLLADANAWFDLVLLLPVLDLAKRKGKELREIVPTVFMVGVAWLAGLTLGLEYVYSHFFGHLDRLYTWLRDTRLVEITYAKGAWRIFLQSQVYLVIGLLLAASRRLFSDEESKTTWIRQPWTWFSAALFAGVLLSFSRSLWMGLAAGLLVLGVFALSRLKRTWKKGLAFSLSLVLGIVLAVVANMVPLPPTDASLRDALLSRVDLQEPAAASRWNLLPKLMAKIGEHPILGSGFGATVSYETKDPRIVAATGGIYETYAFEWGWLEHWIKFGVLGIPAILLILIFLGRGLWKMEESLWLRLAALSSVVALAVTHAFTPYLNHPLGFTLLLLGEGWIATRKDS